MALFCEHHLQGRKRRRNIGQTANSPQWMPRAPKGLNSGEPGVKMGAVLKYISEGSDGWLSCGHSKWEQRVSVSMPACAWCPYHTEPLVSLCSRDVGGAHGWSRCCPREGGRGSCSRCHSSGRKAGMVFALDLGCCWEFGGCLPEAQMGVI